MPNYHITSRPSSIKKALQLRPNFNELFTTSTIICGHCKKSCIDIPWTWTFCDCEACIYCSQLCKDKDNHTSVQRYRSMRIQALRTDINSKTRVLQRDYQIHVTNTIHYLKPVPLVDFEPKRDQINELLDTRRLLINELMREGRRKGGYAGEFANQNMYTYQVAAHHSLDLLLLRKGESVNLVLNIHLLIGKFEEVYNLSHHCLRRDVYSDCVEATNVIWQKKWIHKNITRYHDITTSLFTGIGNGNNLVAIVHIFLVKYMLHMSMENLHQINTHFLNNKDCIHLIGEYVGLKKEWIITDNTNWYRDQAYKVASLLYCYHTYEYTADVEGCFDEIKKRAQEYFPGRTSAIETAVEMGKKWIQVLKVKRKINKEMSSTRWVEVIKSFEADHELVYKTEIQPILPDALGRVNLLAGWDAIGTNANPNLCITEFVTEATKACHGHSFSAIFHFSFDEIFDFDSSDDGFMEGIEGCEFDDFEESFERFDTTNLDHTLNICIAIEQKLAYCNFHMNKGGDSIKEILDQLPNGRNKYISDVSQEDLECEMRKLLYDNGTDVITRWPSDENDLVATLFKQGFATKDNLNILFGRSGYVSYQIWKLQKQQQERRQPSIWSFVTSNRLWKEGCTDIDRRSGLKIKYLNKQDRSRRFISLMQELTKLVPTGSVLRSVVPSIEQFVSKFGWKCLGDMATKQFLMEWISSYEIGTDKVLNMEDNSNPKRRRCDIDSFLTAEDACRHYFDTRSLEEAVWDAAGVPRIIILNGNRERMQKAGWKNIKGGIRGDEGLRLGSRIAHVYSPSCLVYGEQVKPTYENRPEIFSDFDEFKYRRDFTC